MDLSLDIETDTSPLTDAERAAGHTSRGLDPSITPITAVALYDGTTIETHLLTDYGSEADLLAGVIAAIHSRTPGRILSWNGACFDFPFLVARMKALGIHPDYQPVLTFNPALVPKYDPTPGFAGGYDVTWFGHLHADVAYAAKHVAAAAGVAWSLKPVASHFGLNPMQVDRTRMHELDDDTLRRYVASDAVTTHELAALLAI